MANTIISLENVNGRWVGEVEVGSPISRRSVIRADSFEDGMAQIKAAYDGYMETFASRPIFSGSGEASAAPTRPLAAEAQPDPGSLAAAVIEAAVATKAAGLRADEKFTLMDGQTVSVERLNMALIARNLDPINESPKLPRGRHKATCDCPRCGAKKAEKQAAQLVAV